MICERWGVAPSFGGERRHDALQSLQKDFMKTIGAGSFLLEVRLCIKLQKWFLILVYVVCVSLLSQILEAFIPHGTSHTATSRLRLCL